MRRLILILILIVCAPLRALALEVDAVVDRDRIAAGDAIQLTVTVKNGDGDVDIGDIRDFQVTSQGTQTSVRIVNNNVAKEINHTYTLVPLKTGRLMIPALTVTSNGQRVQTRPITITVSKSEPRADPQRNLFVSAEVSNDAPFQGEHVVYRFQFFSARQFKNAGFLKEPAFPGFTAKRIEKERSYRQRLGGRNFNVIEVTYILIPIQAGELTIEPAVLGCDVPSRRRRRSQDPFDNFFNSPFFGNYERKRLTTAPITVKVKPLPPYTGDGAFSGLVGNFFIQAALGDGQSSLDGVKTGDSVTLAVSIRGTGNIMDAGEPKLSIPPEFKVYKDSPEEKIDLTPQGFRGHKVFRQALVPTQAGHYTIEPLKLIFFDIKTQTYRTIASQALALDVQPPEPGDADQAIHRFSASAPSETPTVNKQKVQRTGHDILTVKDGLDSLKSQAPLSWRRFAIYLAAPLALYAVLLLLFKFTRKPDNAARRMARRSEQALKAAQNQGPGDESFFTLLYTALVAAILATADRQGELLTHAEARALLISGGHSEETADHAAALLQRVESARYSGVGADQASAQNLFNDVKEMIRRLARK